MTASVLSSAGNSAGTAAAARDDGAVALLHALSGPAGIHASLSDTANYRAVFARDGVMAGIGGDKATRIGARIAERFWPAADADRRYPIASLRRRT